MYNECLCGLNFCIRCTQGSIRGDQSWNNFISSHVLRSTHGRTFFMTVCNASLFLTRLLHLDKSNSLLISDLHVSSLTTCKSKSTKQVIYLALSSCFKHFYHEINPSNFRFICAVIFTHSVVSSDNRPSTGERAHVLCSTSAVHLLEWP
jgi:hypothetical protein